MSARTRPGEAHLLELIAVGDRLRATLWPIHGEATSALCGYEEIAVDRRELARLTAELRVQLGRASARGMLDPASSAEVRKLGLLLFDELLPPSIKDWLRARQDGELLIRTDESLVDIPWELLHTGRHYLSMVMDMGRLIAAQGVGPLPAPRPMAAPHDILLLADPCGDLDAAYDEGIRLRAVLDGQPWLRVTLQSSEISRAFVRENVREFDILHFAGHAEVDGQGSGWLLSDGRFTAEDVLRLTGGRAFPSLVFANACGSGRSTRREGATETWSLARAFISAGVRHFIGTHWEVPDVVASDFAEHFYRGLCAGLSVGAAVRQARTAAAQTHGEGSVLWAAYCLYGDPHHVYFPEARLSVGEVLDDLPILDDLPAPAPASARAIYHSLDEQAPLVPGSPGLGLNPSLRHEAVLPAPERLALGSAQNLTRALGAAAVAASVILLALIAHQTWEHFQPVLPASALPQTARPALTPPPSTVAAISPVTMEQIREQEAAAAQAAPRVDFSVTAMTRTAQRDLVEVVVHEGTRLRSGDSLRAVVEPQRDVYVALVMIGGRNKPQLLFPHPSVRGADHIRAGTELVLPAADGWFRLDRQAGVETVLLLASRQPLDSLDDLLADMALYTQSARKQRDGGVAIDSGTGQPRSRSDRALGARTRQLAEIQTIAHNHGVEVVQAVTYHHVR